MATTERIPNLAEDDLLDAEVGEFLQNYLQLSGEVGTELIVIGLNIKGNVLVFLKCSIDQKYSN